MISCVCKKIEIINALRIPCPGRNYSRGKLDLNPYFSRQLGDTPELGIFRQLRLAKIVGGKGGDGSISVGRTRKGKYDIPDGGKGGNGGDVYVYGDDSRITLNYLKSYYEAGTGGGGMGKLGVGKRGSDLEIALPVGTTIREISTTSKTNNSFHVPVRYRFLTMDGKILYCIGNRRFCDMALKRNFNIISYYRITDRWKTQLINLICSRDNNQQTLFFSQKAIKYEVQNTHERLKVAQGGIGGTGSFRFRSSELKGAIIAEKGAFPTSKVFEFELKATAEVVIVGFNDAGKFSILSSLITHDFSISAYPYPDVMPKVGAIWFGDIPKVFIADIPSAFLTENINTDEVKYLLPYISRASLILYFAGIKSNNSLREFQRFLYRVNRGGQNGRAKPEIVLIGEITPYGSYSGEISRLARYAKKGGFTFVPASIRPFKDSYPIKGLIKKIVTSAREKEKMAIGM